jgi:hypothetical protein
MSRLKPLLSFFSLYFLLANLPQAFSQKLEIGAGVGGLNYTGDISPNFQLRNFRPGGELFVRYNLKNGFSFRAQGMAGGIAASDLNADNEFQVIRERSFRSLLVEGSVLTEYNFLDYRESRKALNWTPYVYGGLGYLFFKPQPNDGNYRTTSLVIPFGVGVKYQIKRPWSIGVEFGARKTFTDYLDNFGGKEVLPDKFLNGNPALKDMYYLLGVSVSYTFYKIVCP